MLKKRIVSIALAYAMTLGLAIPVGAWSVDRFNSPAMVAEETVVEEQQDAPAGPRFTLDGVEMDSIMYERYKDTYYVSVWDLAKEADSETEVTGDVGVLYLNAQTVVSNDAEDTGVMDTLSMTARVGDCYVEANGRYLFVSSGVRQQAGRVLLPIRTLAAILNLEVAYAQDTDTVILTTIPNAGYITDGADYYDEESLYWLSRVIHLESGNQSMEGQIAVGNVVMNRVRDPQFPNTIEGVLAQKNQFSTYASGRMAKADPGEDSEIAAKLVLEGATVLPTALFFNAKSMKNSYAARKREYVCTIGNHSFYE